MLSMGKIKEGMSGDELIVNDGGVVTVKSGGVIDLKSGAKILTNGAQCAALTAQLATITIADSAGTPDYALQAVTNTLPYGFASDQELISLLYVVKNLQTRCAEIEARLESAGLVVAN